MIQLLKILWSVHDHRLFDLVQQFENCSGLRINQSKSEIKGVSFLRNCGAASV